MWFGIQAILLLSVFCSSIFATGLFERQQCAVPCGSSCGLTGDICCTTPTGNLNLCGYGTTCCLHGCCNFGSICQESDGSCITIITTTSGGQTIISTSTVGVLGTETGSPIAGVLTFPTASGGQTNAITSNTGALGTDTDSPATGIATIQTVSSDRNIATTSTIGVSGTDTNSPNTGSKTVPTASSDQTTTTSTTNSAVGLPSIITMTTTSGTETIVSASSIDVPGIESPTTGIAVTPTVSNDQSILKTSTMGVFSPAIATTLADGQIVTSQNGLLVWGTNKVTIPVGLSSPQTVTTNGEIFTFGLTQTSEASTQTLQDGVVVTSSPGLLLWGTNILTVPTGLTAPVTKTTLGEIFTFQPTGLPFCTSTDVLTETLLDGVVVTSSCGLLFWGTNTITVPTDLESTAVVTTDGETFTFSPPFNVEAESSKTTSTTTSTTAALITYTSWPLVVSILPITSSVPAPQASDNKPVVPCKVWFFFICVSWNLKIGGWQLILPPGIYPPYENLFPYAPQKAIIRLTDYQLKSGPPPGLRFPPGINILGSLPPWPRITIGNDNIPTYSEEPSSCQTESATMFLTTTSFGVSAEKTTATQVLSTSSIIVGCDITDQASTTTTVSACPTTATTCSEVVITLANGTPFPASLVPDNALAMSVYHFVQSIWSDLDDTSTTLATSTLQTLTQTTAAPPTALPIQPSAGSSCLSTITTSICTAPQEPCATSLSCEMWTATTTIQDSPTATIIVPAPTSTWILDLYSATCADQVSSTSFSYYSLEGTGAQVRNSFCISLQHGSDPSYSCGWYTNGGFGPAQPCSAGTFTKPTSFNIRNGFCTIYTNDDCTGVFNGIEPTQYRGCINFARTKFLPETWLSMKCFAYPIK